MMDRIQKIKDTYSEQFRERLAYEKVEISLDSAWDILVSSDLSRNKKNVRWLVETYLKNGYLWEDIAFGPTSKVSETITEFDKHKRNLEPSQRSLMKYETLGSLWSAIKPYIGQLTPGEEKKAERDKAYSEAEIVIDSDEFKVIVPKTLFASKWFGRGTRWCTAADRHNEFRYYALKAPLFIIIQEDGRKYQAWKHQDDIQFMDEDDENVSPYELDSEIYDLFIDYLQESDSDVLMKDASFKTMEEWQISVRKHHYLMSHLPEKYNNQDFYNSLDMATDTDLFKYIPERFITQEMCDSIPADKIGDVFSVIPRAKYNEDIIFKALQTIEDNRYMLERMSYFDFTTTFLNKIKDAGLLHSIFSLLPDSFKTRELCEKAVLDNDYNIAHIPKKFFDYNMCKTILMNPNVKNYDIIPEAFLDIDMYIHGLKYNGLRIKEIPNKYQTRKMYELAVKTNPIVLAHVPSEMVTEKMCRIAVTHCNHNANIIQYIPKHLLKEKMIDFLLNNHRNFLESLTKTNNRPENIGLLKLITEQNIDKACQAFSSLMVTYKPEQLTDRLCEMAMKDDVEIIHQIPDNFITKEVCDLYLDAHKDYEEPYLSLPEKGIQFYLHKYLPHDVYEEQINDIRHKYHNPEHRYKM